MKIIAAILLVIGIGLIGTGVYISYFIETQINCPLYLSAAQTKAAALKAAAGTPKEASLREEATTALVGAESVCGSARQSKQNGMLMMLGGLISIIAATALLVFSRRART